MRSAERNPQTIRLLTLQCELSMCIGTSLELGEMLHRFLVVLTQRLHARAVHVWWRGAEGSIEHHAYPLCSLTDWLADTARSARLEASLDEAFDGAITLQFGPSRISALRVGMSACLFIEHGKASVSEASLAALRTLMPRLALACQACFDHESSRALLELTRLQNAELLAARERADASARSRSEFLAAISHEVRSPLNSIIGFAELLELETGEGEVHDHAHNVLAAGRQLYAVFNDLLDLARLNAQRLVLHPEDIDLAEVCVEVWSGCSLQAQGRGLAASMHLAPGLPSRLVADPVRLRQILNNLLGNAIRYTRAGRVEMNVFLQDGMLGFAISDTGPGIPLAEQDVVFERFRQADSVVHQNSGGTGLGLAISRELAGRMGGRIELCSHPGAGSVFTLFLPRVDPGLGVV